MAQSGCALLDDARFGWLRTVQQHSVATFHHRSRSPAAADFFEAHFNLGNIYHDLGRFNEAQTCYRQALRLNPLYADAHFYLAVTFEKMGQSRDARPHWRSYQDLAPNGEWVELAREFSK